MRLSLILMGLVLASMCESVAVDLAPVKVDSLISHAPSPDTLSSFPYVQLLDQYSIALNSDYTYTSTVHSLALITNSEGIDESGTTTIGYRKGYDSVVVDVARSVAPDGTVHLVPSDQILDNIAPSELMDNDLYTDQRQVRINFQGLRVGSIVECEYTIKRYREYFPGFSTNFWFNTSAPSRLALVSVRYPESLPLFSKLYRTSIEPSVSVQNGFVTRTWRMENIREFPQEPGQLPWSDLTMRVELSSLDDWQQYAKVFYDSLWALDLATPLGECEQEILTSLGLGNLGATDKMKRIYYWLQDNTRYLGFEMGVNNLQPHESSVICRKLYGDCKDLTNLLVKLLRYEGIKAWPAVLNTRMIFNDESFPAFSSLNHVIVFVADVDGREYWLDPTLDHAPLGFLSPSVHNHMAVILGSDRDLVRHIPLTPSGIDRKKVIRRATIDTLGRGRVEGSSEFSGVYGVGLKSYLAQLNQDQLANLFRSNVAPSGHDLQFEVRGLGDCDSAIMINLSFADNNIAQVAGNLLILKANGDDIDFDNSKGIEKRTTDVYIGFTPSFHVESELTYPRQYRVQFLPKDVNMESDFFTFTRRVEANDSGTVRVIKTAVIKAPFIPLAMYEKYRSALQEMYEAQQEGIILERVAK
jgi:transglutaminase-like putative cysteine protease